MRHFLGLVFFAAGLMTAAPSAQERVPVGTLVDRLSAYLLTYQHELSTIVASERYRQSLSRVIVDSQGRRERDYVKGISSRTLESEVAFILLPASGEWFGVRDVERVDGSAARRSGVGLFEILRSPSANVREHIEAIVRAGSEHNLGVHRTTNMPTVPLELLLPRHRDRFVHESVGNVSIAGVRTVEVRFRELRAPSLVRSTTGDHLLATGSVWIEPVSGQLRRVILRLEPAQQLVGLGASRNELRVEFVVERKLSLLVPSVMHETFESQSAGLLRGHATYANFRRFTTAARIIPPR
jgi:hypothetical protein